MAGQPVDVKLFNKWSFEDIEVSMLKVNVRTGQPAAVAHVELVPIIAEAACFRSATASGSGADVQLLCADQ